MATNQTTNYQLNQWEPTDAVQRVEFNQDNAKMDAALKALSDQVVQKANHSALNTVISAVNQKADASTVSSLSSQLSAEISQRQTADNALQAALALKGNCQIYYTSYDGHGQTSRTLIFPAPPLMMVVQSHGIVLQAIRGSNYLLSSSSSPSHKMFPVTWDGNSITWPMSNSTGDLSEGCNYVGYTYYAVALLASDP